MLIPKTNKRALLEFLLHRWKLLSGIAALERVHVAQIQFAKQNNLPPPTQPQITVSQPCKQIDIIKKKIIATLPETHFIDYSYESPTQLDPKDFVEIFIGEQQQCIEKIEALMSKMKIV